MRRTNDLVFHLRERERNGHAHASPPSVHTWMPFTRMGLSIPVAIVGSTGGGAANSQALGAANAQANLSLLMAQLAHASIEVAAVVFTTMVPNVVGVLLVLRCLVLAIIFVVV